MTSSRPLMPRYRTLRPWLAATAALWLCAGMAACGQAPAPTSQSAAPKAISAAEDPKAIVEAAADPCTAAKGLFLTSLCGHPELKDLTAQIKSTLIEEGAGVDRASATVLRDGQQGWIAATRTYCGVDDAAAVLSPDQVGCVKAQLQSRVKEVSELIETRGGFTFQRVEMNEASKPVASAQGTQSPLEDLPVTKQVDYPQLAGDSAPVKAFNALMRETVNQLRPPASEDASQTSEAIAYEIAYAGPELVSVVFTAEQSTPNAMHSDSTTRVVNVLMATGRELTPADVFAAPEARWQTALVQRATTGIRRQLRDLRGVELSQNDIRDTITKPHNWRITERGLVLVFPQNSIGPSVIGVVQVEAPWKDLRALLKPDAPAPIRQS